MKSAWLMRILLVCMLVVGGPATAMADTAPINGFLGSDWGLGLDQVKRNIIDRGATKVNIGFPGFNEMSAGMDKPIAGYKALEALVPINGQSHYIVLSFYQDKFYRAYAERAVLESDLFQEFSTVSGLLRQKYGAPQEITGAQLGEIHRWTSDYGSTGQEGSLKLSLLKVPVGTTHRYEPKLAYQSDKETYYYIVLEYEEKLTAAIVASKVEKPKPPINNSY